MTDTKFNNYVQTCMDANKDTYVESEVEIPKNLVEKEDLSERGQFLKYVEECNEQGVNLFTGDKDRDLQTSMMLEHENISGNGTEQKPKKFYDPNNYYSCLKITPA